MVRVTVLQPFYDLKERVDRNPGDTFLASGKRANEIASKLPGYVRLAEDVPDYTRDELEGKRVQELGAIAEEMGLEIPRRAKKAQLIDLILGE